MSFIEQLVEYLAFEGVYGLRFPELLRVSYEQEWLTFSEDATTLLAMALVEHPQIDVCMISDDDIGLEDRHIIHRVKIADQERSKPTMVGSILSAPRSYIMSVKAEERVRIFLKGQKDKKNLTDVAINVLELIAVSRAKGITQTELSKVLDMDSRSVFYYAKKLIQKGIVFKRPVAHNGAFTQLLVMTRFGSEANEVQEDMRDVAKFRARILTALDAAANKTMAYEDLRGVCELNPEDHLYFKRTLCRLEENGFIERFYVKLDGRDVRCARLIKENVPDESEIPTLDVEASGTIEVQEQKEVDPDAVDAGPELRIDLNFDTQIFYAIVRSGKVGITMNEIFQKFGSQKTKTYGRILETMVEKFKAPCKIRRVKEIVGKEQRYRYFLAGNVDYWSDMYGKSIEKKEEENKFQTKSELIAVPAFSGEPDLVPSVLSSDLRKKNLLQMIEEAKVVEMSQSLIEEFERRFEGGEHKVCRKTILRMARDLESKKKMKIVKASIIAPTGAVVLKTLFLHNSIHKNGQEVNDMVKKLNDKMIEVLPKQPGRFYKNVKVERVQFSEQEDDGDASGDEDETEQDKTAYAYRKTAIKYGFVFPKLSRARLLHQYIFAYCNDAIEDSNEDLILETGKLFRILPLQLCLRVVGVWVDAPEITEYIENGGDLSAPIGTLPYSITRYFYRKSAEKLKRTLRTVFDILTELKLVQPNVDSKILTSSGLPGEYKILKRIPFTYYARGTGLYDREEDIESFADVNRFWSELEFASLNARKRAKYVNDRKKKLATDAEAEEDLNRKDAMQVDNPDDSNGRLQLLLPSNWNSAASLSDNQIEKLIENIEDLSKLPPMDESEVCQTLAETIQIPMNAVLNYYTAYKKQNSPVVEKIPVLKQRIAKKKSITRQNVTLKSLKERREEYERPQQQVKRTERRPRQKRAMNWTQPQNELLMKLRIIYRNHLDELGRVGGVPWRRIHERFFSDKEPNDCRRRFAVLMKHADIKMEYESMLALWKKTWSSLVQRGKLKRPEDILQIDIDAELSEYDFMVASNNHEAMEVAESDEEDFEDITEFLRTHEIIYPEPEEDECYIESGISNRLQHALLQDAAYAETPKARVTRKDTTAELCKGWLKSLFMDRFSDDYEQAVIVDRLRAFSQETLQATIDELKNANLIVDDKGKSKYSAFKFSKRAWDLLSSISDEFFKDFTESVEALSIDPTTPSDRQWKDAEIYAICLNQVARRCRFRCELKDYEIQFKTHKRSETPPYATIIIDKIVIGSGASKRKLAEFDDTHEVKRSNNENRRPPVTLVPIVEKPDKPELVWSGNYTELSRLIVRAGLNKDDFEAEVGQSKIIRAGYNEFKYFVASNSKLANHITTQTPQGPLDYPSIWNNLSGTFDSAAFKRCAAAVMTRVIKYPGVSFERLHGWFQLLLSRVELASIVEYFTFRGALRQTELNGSVFFSANSSCMELMGSCKDFRPVQPKWLITE